MYVFILYVGAYVDIATRGILPRTSKPEENLDLEMVGDNGKVNSFILLKARDFNATEQTLDCR